MKEKSVYIVLSQTYSSLARAIKLLTHGKYSHASISFDKNCTAMYSFGRKYVNFPFYGIFSRESIYKGLFAKNKNASIAIYEIKVSDYKYKKIKEKVDEIKYKNKGYNILGLLLAGFKIKLHREKYYCSEFVYEVLSSENIDVLSKEKVVFKPDELVRDNSFIKIFEGKIIDYA